MRDQLKKLHCLFKGHDWKAYPVWTVRFDPPEPHHACARCGLDIGDGMPDPEGMQFLLYRAKRFVKTLFTTRKKTQEIDEEWLPF